MVLLSCVFLLSMPGFVPEIQGISTANVSCHAAFISMAEFCADLSKQTGQKILIAEHLADRKLTINCQNKPLAEVLTKFATTFGGTWAEVGRDLRFDLSPATKSAEQQAIDFEHQRVKEAVRHRIEALVEVGKADPDERKRMLREAEKEQDALAAKNLSVDDPRVADIDSRLEVLRSGNWPSFGAAIEGKENQIVSALLDRRTVFGVTGRGNGVVELPKSFFVSSLDQGAREVLGEDFVGCTLFQLKKCGEWLHRASFFGRDSGSNSVVGPDLRGASAEPPVGSLRLTKILRDWEAITDPAVLGTPMNPIEGGKVQGMGYSMPGLTVADQLLNLSERSGVPVIADAFRLATTVPRWFTANAVGDWIHSFNQHRFLHFLGEFKPGHVRTEGGWLMFRYGSYWTNLEPEVPERLLQPMERKQHDLGLDIDDYANLSASLTPEQADGISRGVLVGFDLRPLSGGFNTLLLWSSLSQTQKEQALGAGLPMSSLSSDQTGNMREVLAEGMGNSLRALLPLLCGTQPSQPLVVRCKGFPGELNEWKQTFGTGSGGQVAPRTDANFSIRITMGTTDLTDVMFSLPTKAGI
jgi:hypothetical protein